jgi:ribonuclease Z
MEIIFLGTACMQPTKERNHPGVLLVRKGEGILFDCGEGIQRQLKVAGIKPTIISKILITHWHGDHVLGLPGLLQTISASGYSGNLEVYGPKGTKKRIALMKETFASKELIPFSVKEVSKGKICEEDEYALHTAEMKHGTPCIGFSLVEKNRRKVLISRANKLNIPEGPLLGKLQDGKTITHNGEKIKPDQVTTTIMGKKLTYITDTLPCSNITTLAKDSDILILESTYKSDLQEKAKEYYHLTAHDAATLANDANVKKLILTHFSGRYKDVKELEEDARDIFHNTQAAEDMMRFIL